MTRRHRIGISFSRAICDHVSDLPPSNLANVKSGTLLFRRTQRTDRLRPESDRGCRSQASKHGLFRSSVP